MKASPRTSTTAQAPPAIKIVEGHVELDREYIRPAKVPLVFGLSRSHTFVKIADGTLESVLIKQPGARRGTRLISVSSLKKYIASFATK